MSPFLSICVPSYNRPFELRRLLNSICTNDSSKIEIVICEDNSHKRSEIREQVESFKESSDYNVHYIENTENYGYDRNLRELIKHASGEYITYMGDDDEFVAGGIDKLIKFLENNKSYNLGYVLKTHLLLHSNGKTELFKYFSSDRIFPHGQETYITLFRRSVFISGFTFRRSFALLYMTDDFDGTLLFQLYLLAELTMNYNAVFFSEPIVFQYEGGIPFFGSSESEKKLYDVGEITIRNSINFMMGFFKITQFIDQKYNINSTDLIRKEFSKYSYPVLSIQRRAGIKNFLEYAKKLKVIGIDNSIYYYIYFVALLLLGEQRCNSIIVRIKRLLGRTPIL